METGSGQVVVSLETPPSTLVGTESRVTDGPIQTGALTQRIPSCLESASTALWTAGQSRGAKVSSNTGEAPASGGTPQQLQDSSKLEKENTMSLKQTFVKLFS